MITAISTLPREQDAPSSNCMPEDAGIVKAALTSEYITANGVLPHTDIGTAS